MDMLRSWREDHHQGEVAKEVKNTVEGRQGSSSVHKKANPKITNTDGKVKERAVK